MSFNLVDLVKDQLGGPALGQLGALLGEDNQKTEAALGAAVPGLLSGLTSSAKADGGASLFNAVKDQDDSMLDNIGGLRRPCKCSRRTHRHWWQIIIRPDGDVDAYPSRCG